MKPFIPYLLSIAAVAAPLAARGGSQPPIGAPGGRKPRCRPAVRATMKIAKVLCLSLLTIMGSSPVGGVTFAGQTWPSEFQDQATVILERLFPAFKKNPTGVRISYVARCDRAKDAVLIPPLRLKKVSRSSTMLEAARIVFSDDDTAVVSSGKLDNVRINIGNAPDALLQTNIATLRLNPIEQYNPINAIEAIVATKEVKSAAAALHLEPQFVINVQLIQQPAPGLPHLPSILQNLTADQISDIIAARFKGAVLYGVCTQGPQPRQFSIDFFYSDQWT